jgi:hypothetical protein
MNRRSSATLSILFLAIFAALVAAKVHGFSIGVWDLRSYVPDTVSSYSCRRLGVPRPIRSDEWCVSTPQVIAQCTSPGFFPRMNRRVGGGTDMFLATPCNPVWDGTVPGQFHNWGYFLLGAERGLAWNWWCRYLGIPLFAYLFFLGWLGRDRALAATAALAVTLGAPTQWWDTTLPYLLLYFFSGLVFVRLVASPGTRAPAKALASAGLFVSIASYAFAGYPPFAILLFPAFLILGWQIVRPENRAAAAAEPERRPLLSRPGFWFSAVLLALAAEFAYFAAVHAETLRTIAGSSYPGRRVVLGGSFATFLRQQALDVVGLFVPFPGCRPSLSAYRASNPCMAARYFVPGTGLFVLCVLHRRILSRARVSDVLLVAWGGWLSLWNALPFPRWLAMATGMFPFPPHRAEVVSGLVFLLAVFRVFHLAEARGRRREAILAAVLSVAFLANGALVPENPGGFFSTVPGIRCLIAGAVLCAAVTAGLVSGSRWLFCGGYVALSLVGGAAVHPITRGISPIADKELAALVREVDAREPGRWMSNQWTTGNFLLAQGLDCEPGTQTYAHRSFWSAIDPEGAKEREWNRYGHRVVRLSKDGSVDVAAAGDVIRFSVTERAIRDLGVSHLVWSGEKLHEPWLRYEGRSRLHFVYTVLPEGAGPSDEGRGNAPGEGRGDRPAPAG